MKSSLEEIVACPRLPITSEAEQKWKQAWLLPKAVLLLSTLVSSLWCVIQSLQTSELSGMFQYEQKNTPGVIVMKLCSILPSPIPVSTVSHPQDRQCSINYNIERTGWSIHLGILTVACHRFHPKCLLVPCLVGQVLWPMCCALNSWCGAEGTLFTRKVWLETCGSLVTSNGRHTWEGPCFPSHLPDTLSRH